MGSDFRKDSSFKYIFWLILALFVMVLLYLIFGLAVKNNSLYSNREVHGISKYQFIEQCQHGIGGDLDQFTKVAHEQGMIEKNDVLKARFAVGSKNIVDSVVSKAPEVSWYMITPMAIYSKNNKEVISKAVVECMYDKEKNEVMAMLSPTN